MMWIRLTGGFKYGHDAQAWLDALAPFYRRKGIDLSVHPDPVGRSFYVWRTTVERDYTELCCRDSRSGSSCGTSMTVIDYLRTCEAGRLWDGAGTPPPGNYAIGALERAEAAKTPKRKEGAV
jgi:hypothetical protein